MGILGLTSFVDENPFLLTDFHLCDTKIVIDGNNLYHFLYSYFNITSHFGGDYDVFALGIKTYFQKLKLCNVEAYVIFDGAYTPDDKKLATSLHRARERIKNVESIATGNNGKISPIFVYETFRSVLDELSVKHITCDYEADNQLAAIANKFQCPVMSNDSDFFIYDVKAGFILIDYINMHVINDPKVESKNSKNYLNVQIFYLDTLLSYFPGIDREVIPLYATILGNDYIPKEAFETFFANCKLPSANEKPFFIGSKGSKGRSASYSKFVQLLLWLESKNSLDDAIESTMKYIHKSKKEEINRLLIKSINEYVNPGTELLNHLCHDDPEEALSTDKMVQYASELKTCDGNKLPQWFIEKLRHGLMPVYICLNPVVSRRVILLAQVEDLSQVSAYSCSQSLREILYSILLTVDIGKENLTSKSHDNMIIEEYCRKGRDMKKNQIQPLNELKKRCITIPNLDEIQFLSQNIRLEYMLKFLNVSGDVFTKLQSIVSDCYILPVIVLLYWIENVNPSVNNVHVKTLLVYFLFKWLKENNGDIEEINQKGICPHDIKSGSVSKDQTEDISTNDKVSHLGYGILTKDVKIFIEKLKSFSTAPSRVLPPDIVVIHTYTQFQTCLQAAMCLNQVLLCPLVSPNPSVTVSGSFLLNLYKVLKNRKYPTLYLEEMFGRKSTVFAHVDNIYSLITNSLSSGEKLLICRPGSKNAKSLERKKQKKKQKMKDKKPEVKQLSEKAGSCAVNVQEESAVKSNCNNKFVDINNKFSLLQVETE